MGPGSRFVRVAALALMACGADAAQRRETLIYSRFDVDPGEWRYFEFPAKEPQARLEVRFEVLGPKDSPGVRVAVQKEDQFQRFRQKQTYQDLEVTEYRRRGRLQARLTEPGGYAVVVDNRQEARRRARVDLEVVLTTGPDPETLPVAYAPPEKRRIVVAVSLAGFLAILLIGGRALWRAVKASRRRELVPPPQWY